MLSKEDLHCQFCKKPLKSMSGKTLHEKTCEASSYVPGPVERNTMSRGNTMPRNSNNDDDQGYDYEYDDHRDDRRQRSYSKQAEDQRAFILYPDHIPMLINKDLAAEIARIILNSGTDNKAVLAFAHQSMSAIG